MSNPTTKLRVEITEGANGQFNVEWQSSANGVDVVMRPSHVIGQLQTAAMVIAAQSFEGIRGKFGQAVGKSKSEGKKHGSG